MHCTYTLRDSWYGVLGDIIELDAVQRLFQESLLLNGKFYVSSSKGAIGHLLGAAGAVESVSLFKLLLLFLAASVDLFSSLSHK